MINWKNIINSAWKNISTTVENNYSCSSEKTLVFLMACEIKELVNDSKLVIDFESQPYENITDDISKEKNKFLDLLIYTDEKSKIALEIKFPFNNNGNTNQTQTREKIYRDLFRLNYLVNNKINHIQEGYFLMAVNEDAYLNKGTYKSSYHTYHDFDLTNYEPQTEEYQLNLNNRFLYQNIKNNGKKNINSGNFSYLNPIRII